MIDTDLYAKCVHFSNVARGKAHINDQYDVIVDKSIPLDKSASIIHGHLVYR